MDCPVVILGRLQESGIAPSMEPECFTASQARKGMSNIQKKKKRSKLFIAFVAISCFSGAYTSTRVLQFLAHLEDDRGCSGRTRNQRLAAIRAFARFVASRDPGHVEWSSHIRAIPSKRTTPRPISGFGIRVSGRNVPLTETAPSLREVSARRREPFSL